MTLAEIISYANAHLAADDYDYDVHDTTVEVMEVIFDDTDGYDEHEFVDEEAVDNFLAYLDEHAMFVERRDRMYPEWIFDGFSVRVSYTSYDI